MTLLANKGLQLTESEFEELSQKLAAKLRHYLITQLGRLPDKANRAELFQALSHVLRERVMINWAATERTIDRKKDRRLFYLSMEYLPGRMLTNNITNLHAHQLMKRVAHLCNFDYAAILNEELDPGLGNGGLGRLASCLLDSMATQQYPARAYGLRYQYGIFEQQLWDGKQIESPDNWLSFDNPWGLRHDAFAQKVKFEGIVQPRINRVGEGYNDLEGYDMVRALPYDYPIVGYAENELFNVATLRLWSTKESPRNFQLQRFNAGHLGHAAENTGLTDVLYPNDDHDLGKRIRLKQEFLLVSASLQDIIDHHKKVYGHMENFNEKVRIQINDTHPALVIAELIRLLIKHDHYTFDKAFGVTEEVVSYTNHTTLPEALEEWNQKRVASLLPRQFQIIQQLNQKFLDGVRATHPDADIARLSCFGGDQTRMANLAIIGSHKVNGVAKLHGQILKESTFKAFVPIFPNKFTYVTNGVTQRKWLLHANPLLSEWISSLIGENWLRDFSEISKLKSFASDRSVLERLITIKRRNKERFIGHLQTETYRHDFKGNPRPFELQIDCNALFDVQVKRLHEYKRQFMNALHLVMLYHELLENPDARPIKRVSIIGGKAAAGYTLAKYIIQFIYMVARQINKDERIKDKLKIILLENYSVSKAEVIMPATELSEQISTAGMEASGTGNMKFAMNGALTIGTEDGANIEMRESIGDKYWPFSFGAHSEEIQKMRGSYSPWQIYGANGAIRRAVDSLKEGSFAVNDREKEITRILFSSLMEGAHPDQYFLLYDLPAYYETQKKVEALYTDPYKWAELVVHNIGGMGPFSSDAAVSVYAKEIWSVQPAPLDPQIFAEAKKIFTNPLNN